MIKNSTVKKNLKLAFYIAILIPMCMVFLHFFTAKRTGNVWYKGFGKICDVRINNKLYSNVRLSRFNFGTMKRHTRIVIKTILPKKLKNNTNLVIRTFYSTVFVYADGKNLYSYGKDLYKDNKMLGSGYHFITIPTKYEGKAISIVMDTSTFNAFRMVKFFKLCKKNNPSFYVFYSYTPVLFISFFMLTFGLIGCICSLLFFSIKDFSDGHIFYVFLTSFLSGLWTNCSSVFFHFLSKNYELGTFLEFFSLYFMVLSYLVIVSKIENEEKYKHFFNFAKTSYIIFLIIAFTLHILKIIFLPEFLTIMHLTTTIVMIIIAYTLAKNHKKQKPYERVLLDGVVAATMLGVLQIILFNLDRYLFKFSIEIITTNLFMMLAANILVVSLFISYVIKIYGLRNYEKEIIILKKYAFKDNLTNLDNRESGTRVLKNLVENKIPYYLIIFDLNNLKKANDKYGHKRGDKLIKDFADCLNLAFSDDKCENIRYGGDEFLVILRSYTDNDVKKQLKSLQQYIDKANLKTKNIDDVILSVAYGIASSTEIKENNYTPVLDLADKRMYKNKLEMKKAVTINQ